MFRNIWLLFMVCMLASSLFLFKKGEKERTNLERANSRIIQLNRELRNMQSLSAALMELDNLTIDEKTATRLEILRHLDLEKSKYDFILNSSQDLPAGETKVSTRNFTIRTVLPYKEVMGLVDQLHANRKILLSDYSIRPSGEPGDKVLVTVDGRLYGLGKR